MSRNRPYRLGVSHLRVDGEADTESALGSGCRRTYTKRLTVQHVHTRRGIAHFAEERRLGNDSASCCGAGVAKSLLEAEQHNRVAGIAAKLQVGSDREWAIGLPWRYRQRFVPEIQQSGVQSILQRQHREARRGAARA